MKDVIIIGGGPAGLTASIYVSRANLTSVVIEGPQPGGQLTLTSDIENFPGFPEAISGPQLMSNIRAQAEHLGAEFVMGEVKGVDFSKKPFTVKLVEENIKSRSVIIATGASARWLGLESERKLRGMGVSACATCDGFFFKGKEVCVIGGGDTALEDALFLTNFVSKVTVVHRRDELRGSKALQKRTFDNPKIEFAWNSVVDEILGVDQNKVEGIRVKDTKNGDKRNISCDGVFVAIGHVPNTKIFSEEIKLDEMGYVITEKGGASTSVAGVFAAGDCQDKTYRQAITAAGSGCMAAIEAERFLQDNN